MLTQAPEGPLCLALWKKVHSFTHILPWQHQPRVGGAAPRTTVKREGMKLVGQMVNIWASGVCCY